jgi:hypothetical protein
LENDGVSHTVARLLSVAITRQDDRELEYQVGDPVVSEGLNFHPPWVDPIIFVGEMYDGAGGVGGVITLSPVWDDRIRYGGYSNFPYRIRGVVNDSVGNPITNAVCSLFRTSDDAWMYDAVSQPPDGQYDFGVPDNVTTYYVVAFDLGGARQGVTVNTLTGVTD